jgi:hypothetical protein
VNDVEAAVQHWRDVGPLYAESTKLLIDLKDANLTDQPEKLIWASFVLTLTDEQKTALLEVLTLVDRDEAFRWF